MRRLEKILFAAFCAVQAVVWYLIANLISLCR